jgi:multiple sugar transport system substrate-binding protein
MVFGDPAEQAAFRGVVESFHATNPANRVEIIALPEKLDYMARLSSDFAAGAPPDVFLLNYRRLAQFHNRDALESLGPKLQAHPQLDINQFYPIAIEAFSDAAGTLVCIPQNISSQVVYYNKDMFDAANQPYPDPNWTWAEFRQTALALTTPDTNNDNEPDQYGLGLEPTIIRVAPFIWQNGGELVDDVAQPTRLTLDTPPAREAMEFMMALSTVDQVVPNMNAEIVQTHGDRFLSGNIAMYVNSRRIVPVMREVAKFNWDVAPLPRGKQTAGILHSDGYCLAASSTVKEAAWEFIAFAIGEEGQKIASQLGRTVPSLRHVAESQAFLDPSQPPAQAQVWLDIAPHLRLLPRLENWVEIERAAGIELEQVYIGQQSLDVAINNIQNAAATSFAPLE